MISVLNNDTLKVRLTGVNNEIGTNYEQWKKLVDPFGILPVRYCLFL